MFTLLFIVIFHTRFLTKCFLSFVSGKLNGNAYRTIRKLPNGSRNLFFERLDIGLPGKWLGHRKGEGGGSRK